MRTGRIARISLAVALALAGAAISASAQEFEMPTRKPGLWEVRMLTGQPGMPEMTTQFCTDAESDKAMMQAGLSGGQGECEPPRMARDGDTITINTTCPTGPLTMTIKGDFESAYTMEVTGAAGGMTQEARWLGETCTDGMVPGDMMMPGGMKMNIQDIMKMGGGAP